MMMCLPSRPWFVSDDSEVLGIAGQSTEWKSEWPCGLLFRKKYAHPSQLTGAKESA
jgi:hypothetical protein